MTLKSRRLGAELCHGGGLEGSWMGHRFEGGPYSNMISEAWRRQLE